MSRHTETSSAKRACYKCGFENRIGIIFCEQCGAPITTSARNTMQVSRELPKEVVEQFQRLSDSVSGRPSEIAVYPDTMFFDLGMSLHLNVEHSGEVIRIEPIEERLIVLGRDDPDDHFTPQIDLIPYGGYKCGISRRHAALKLYRRRMDLVDLKSSNGTFINYDRLEPGEPCQLRNGDQIRLGTLSMMVEFSL